jgi:hypothetical protein
MRAARAALALVVDAGFIVAFVLEQRGRAQVALRAVLAAAVVYGVARGARVAPAGPELGPAPPEAEVMQWVARAISLGWWTNSTVARA